MVEDLIAIAIMTIQMGFQSEIVNAMIRVWVLHKVRCLTQVIVSIPREDFFFFSWDYG